MQNTCQADIEVQFFLSVIQSSNKKFPAHKPLSPYDPTNGEACHFRIIRKNFTYKN